MTQIHEESVPCWHYVGEDEEAAPYVWIGPAAVRFLGEEIQAGVYLDDDVIYEVLLQDDVENPLTLRRIWGA